MFPGRPGNPRDIYSGGRKRAGEDLAQGLAGEGRREPVKGRRKQSCESFGDQQ